MLVDERITVHFDGEPGEYPYLPVFDERTISDSDLDALRDKAKRIAAKVEVY